MDLGKILPLVIGVLGVVGFIAGFLPAASFAQDSASLSVSVFGGGPSYLPILLVIVGLFACAPLLPGGRKYALPVLLLSGGALLGAIGAVASSTVLSKLAESGGAGSASKGFGIWLLLIVAVLQFAAAGYAWFTEAGSGKPAGSAAGRGAGQSARSFGPSHAPAQGAGSQPAPTAQPNPGSAPSGYAPQGFGQGDSAPYGGEQYAGYGSAPSGNPGSGAPATGPVTGQHGVSPEQQGGQSGQYGPATGRQSPFTGQQGPDDGPPPDVTQQVRF